MFAIEWLKRLTRTNPPKGQTEKMIERKKLAAKVDKLPWYWKYRTGGDTHKIRDVTKEMKGRLEWAMNKFAKPDSHGIGRDSHDVKFDKFAIVSVKLVENPSLWKRYALWRENSQDADRHIDSMKLPPKMVKFDPPKSLLEPLVTKSNEVYLFHGTTDSVCDAVAREGFDPRLGGGLFGQGAYFAESASKSDQYVSGTTKNMFVARVALGRPHVTRTNMTDARRPPCSNGCRTCTHPKRCHSIIFDDRTFRFREFIVYDITAAYPEFLVQYKRVSHAEAARLKAKDIVAKKAAQAKAKEAKKKKKKAEAAARKKAKKDKKKANDAAAAARKRAKKDKKTANDAAAAARKKAKEDDRAAEIANAAAQSTVAGPASWVAEAEPTEAARSEVEGNGPMETSFSGATAPREPDAAAGGVAGEALTSANDGLASFVAEAKTTAGRLTVEGVSLMETALLRGTAPREPETLSAGVANNDSAGEVLQLTVAGPALWVAEAEPTEAARSEVEGDGPMETSFSGATAPREPETAGAAAGGVVGEALQSANGGLASFVAEAETTAGRLTVEGVNLMETPLLRGTAPRGPELAAVAGESTVGNALPRCDVEQMQEAEVLTPISPVMRGNPFVVAVGEPRIEVQEYVHGGAGVGYVFVL
jgi:hypothetical protein